MEVFHASLSGSPLFRVVGDVDHFSAPELEALARDALARDGRRILFDLSAVGYLDSAGAGVFLTLDRYVRPGGRVGVIGASANLLRVFEIVGLTSRPSFQIFAHAEEASAAFSDSHG